MVGLGSSERVSAADVKTYLVSAKPQIDEKVHFFYVKVH